MDLQQLSAIAYDYRAQLTPTKLAFAAVKLIWFLSMLVAHDADATAQSVPASADKSPVAVIDVHDGRVSADVEWVSLPEVLTQLTQKAAVKVRFDAKSLSATQVFAVFRDVPLERAIARLLQGVSYTLRRDADGLTIDVLTTGIAQNLVSSIGLDGSRDPAQRVHAGVPIGAKVPEQPDRTLSAAQRAQLDEAEQRLAAGSSLDEQALADLAEIVHPETTEALIDAVALGGDANARALAVDALWRHASNLQFADASVNDTLRELARDRDQAVRHLAQQALLDMQGYRERAF